MIYLRNCFFNQILTIIIIGCLTGCSTQSSTGTPGADNPSSPSQMPCTQYPLSSVELQQLNSDIQPHLVQIQQNLARNLTPAEAYLLTYNYGILRGQLSRTPFPPQIIQCESSLNGMTRFALDGHVIQIGSRTPEGGYVRFGISFNFLEHVGEQAFVELNSVEGPNLERNSQQTLDFVERQHRLGSVVVAVLGYARTSRVPPLVTRERTNAALNVFRRLDYRPITVLNGGYMGYEDNVYGITRSAHEFAEFFQTYAMQIFPAAAERQVNRNPDYEEQVGNYWGDDTKALTQAADIAFVFGPYGFWTEIEVANLRAKGKPFLEFNVTTQSNQEIEDAARAFLEDPQTLRVIRPIHARGAQLDPSVELGVEELPMALRLTNPSSIYFGARTGQWWIRTPVGPNTLLHP